jgi:ribonuclease P protein subunit RPR2
MGKNKDKDEMPNPTSVTNRDILQRLNFLYQASVLLNGLAPPRTIPDDDDPTPNDRGTGAQEGDPPSRPKKSPPKKRRRVVGFEELSRSYVETMKSVGQKTNVKMCVLEFLVEACLVDAPPTGTRP